MHKKNKLNRVALLGLGILLMVGFTQCNNTGKSQTNKPVELKILDNGYLMVHIKDGEVVRRDDGTGECAYMGHCHSADGSEAIYYGDPLNTDDAVNTTKWAISSRKDDDFGKEGVTPTTIHRKSKLNGMSISSWNENAGDYVYDITREHYLYIQLPSDLKENTSYTLITDSIGGLGQLEIDFTYDIFENRSEAIHANLTGFTGTNHIKAADLYHWMGDGGARDYSEFEGNTVYLLNLDTDEREEVGTVKFWKENAAELEGYHLANSDIWSIDFNGNHEEGNYRLAVEGVGCSDDFRISNEVYADPFRVSLLGFFYMRLGQDSPDIDPRPRKPLFIPGVDGTQVPIATLHPYHPFWEDIRQRKTDPWDHPDEYEDFVTGRYNDDAWGGHSDAYDWDKRLPHVSIVYDMLLPYILTGGEIKDDDLGIAESGNGMPDLLDEVQYEVDSWLRLRDGKGYAHGITCPYDEENRIRYQSANTAVAAWANALNSAMLAEAFRIAGEKDLMQEYLDSATVAFNYAGNLDDPMLDNSESDGTGRVRGRDFKMMAAAYLYNLTGDTNYEDIMADECVLNRGQSTIIDSDRHNQIWGVAGYLATPQKVNYPELQQKMKETIIAEAKEKEAGFMETRPSRRATCQESGYFTTLQNMQRTIIAHYATEDPAEKHYFMNAMIMEYDWSMGRNPINTIHMTTASTPLESERSVTHAYTSGYNDGTPGLHPGHTPYWNMNDWAPGMIMGKPSWLASHGYPEQAQWPKSELAFNTDYMWSPTEFTPQQTMRGKTALYGYLYGLRGKE